MKTSNQISLPMLVWRWVKQIEIKIGIALFRVLYKYTDKQAPYCYWMNILRCKGGGEKMLPCQYIFPTPLSAALHRKVTESSPTWEYITTVKILSDQELTVTDYETMLNYDENYQELIRQMREGSEETADREFLGDKRRLEKNNTDWLREVNDARNTWLSKHKHE